MILNGILIVDKPINLTSRDVVNKVCKALKTKKIGHTGTLDPIATGVLVLCIGKATKLVDVITSEDKEYVATVKLGILTDTFDVDGKVIKTGSITLDKEKLVDTLNSFIGTYNQEVPIYSAIKVNGKKLYEYARSGKKVTLPKRSVTIKSIKLLSSSKDSYKFKVLVSKGTYIRSLIRDINDKLGIIGVMSGLKRIKQGNFDIKDAISLDDIENNNYKLLSITEVLMNDKCILIDDDFYKKIKNGCIINNVYNSKMVKFVYKNEIVAIYKEYNRDKTKMKPYKMF